jgi:hypothetical protein
VAREGLRRQLPSNIFVQFLAGPHEIRTGVVGFMLRLIAYISLVVGPLALLVLFQFQFLPYHHEPTTWWQRFAVVADLALLWMLWPSIVHRETAFVVWRDLLGSKVVAATLASLIPLVLVFGIATFPGEWLDKKVPSLPFVPTKWPPSTSTPTEWTSLHELLFGGAVDSVAQRPASLWSNRLVLPGIDVVDHMKFDTEAKMAAAREVFSLRGRRLEGAVLIGAQMPKTDFTAVQLEGATLEGAQLTESKFECAPPDRSSGILSSGGDSHRCAQLSYVSFESAHLEGASLNGAQLRSASLRAYLGRVESGDSQRFINERVCRH